MKYDTIRAFEKHLQNARPNHFAQVYLILGKEALDSKEALDLVTRYVFPDNRTHSLEVYQGNVVVAEDILAELNSLSFLTQSRGFIIRSADKLKKNVQEALEVYIARPQKGHYLILEASDLSKSSSFYKVIEKEGVVLEPAELKSWEKEKSLMEWIARQATVEHKSISNDACQSLVKYAGADSSLLTQELNKLLCYVGDRKEVTLDDVGAVCTDLNAESVWQLGEVIFQFDAGSAIRIFHRILSDSNALLPLLRQIRNQFQTGYQISMILQQGGGASEVMQEFSYMKGRILERNVSIARQYGVEKYKKGLLAIDEAEMQAKNSQMEDSLIGELLLIKLSTRN